jgi:hypothetical protein
MLGIARSSTIRAHAPVTTHAQDIASEPKCEFDDALRLAPARHRRREAADELAPELT